MLKRLTMILLGVLAISTLVSAQDAPAPQTPAAAQPARSSAAQLANIRLELTIVDQRIDTSGTPKTVTLVIEDRQSGRIRTGRGTTSLNVDGRAEILREGRIRVVSAGVRPAGGPRSRRCDPLLESITALLEMANRSSCRSPQIRREIARCGWR